MIVYLSLKYYQSPEVNKYASLLPIFIATGLAVRWVNYFYLLLPLVSYYLISEKKEKGSAILGIFHDKEVRDKVCDREIDVSNFSAS